MKKLIPTLVLFSLATVLSATEEKSELDLQVEKNHPMPDFAPLLELVDNWNNVPERAFPDRITINEPLEYKVIQNGVESNHKTAPAGHAATPLKFKPGKLLVTAGPNPNMKAVVDLDKTDFKEQVAKKYDLGIEKIKTRVFAAREKMKTELAASSQNSAKPPVAFKSEESRESHEGFVTFEFSAESAHRMGLPKPNRNIGRDVPARPNGAKKMLAVRAIRDGEPRDTVKRIREADSQIRSMYEQLDRYWLFSSYGNLWVASVTMAPVVTLNSQDGSDPKTAVAAALHATAKSLGKSSGDDLKDEFDFVTVIFDRDQQMGAVASVNGWKARIGDFRPHVLIHEICHNLGQGPHYCAWVPSGSEDPISGSGMLLERGYPFSSLGGFRIDNKNTLTEPLQAKQRFGWITMGSSKDDQIQIVKKSGLYRIDRFDVNSPKGVLGLLIDRPGSVLGTRGEGNQFTHYLLSYVARKTAITEEPKPVGNRLPGDLENYIGKGLLVERVAYDEADEILTETCIIDCNYEPGAKLLTQRNMQAAKCLSNSFLEPGKTLSDDGAGISIRVKNLGGEGEGKYIEVELELN